MALRFLLINLLLVVSACVSTEAPAPVKAPDAVKAVPAPAVNEAAPVELIEAAPVEPAEAPVEVIEPPRDPLTIIAVGDMMIGTDFPEDRLPPQDGATSFSGVSEILRNADITFGNLEGVLQDGGEPFKVCKDPSLCYLFRTPARYAQYFADAGFDVISLANNHARDFGEEGRSSSMAALDQYGIVHSGGIGDIASWEYKNYRLAMIAFAPNPGSYDINDIPVAAALVASLANSHDLVIVSFHGGAEGLDALHVRDEMEIYYGEDRGNLVQFSHQMIDAGADLVIGHGPHVPRGLEIYNHRLIAYSLGNFNTYQGISIAGIKGLAPILKVRLAPDGEFLDGEIISTRQARPGGPQPDSTHEAARLMKELSDADFAQRAPRISATGQLSR